MRLPAIAGLIDRRILANYRIDADVMAAALPPPFEPQLVGGYAIGGICLIRLRRVRPAWLPLPLGLSSENAAHRVAVRWRHEGAARTGVYIPRRDTNSRLNAWAGGRVFAGQHHRATFEVSESDDHLDVSMRSRDDAVHVRVTGTPAETLPQGSVFGSVAASSKFFESGSLGYSATQAAGQFDGLELCCRDWRATQLRVSSISSSYFDDPARFPMGSVTFDHALWMYNIEHTWISRGELR